MATTDEDDDPSFVVVGKFPILRRVRYDLLLSRNSCSSILLHLGRKRKWLHLVIAFVASRRVVSSRQHMKYTYLLTGLVTKSATSASSKSCSVTTAEQRALFGYKCTIVEVYRRTSFRYRFIVYFSSIYFPAAPLFHLLCNFMCPLDRCRVCARLALR